MDNSGIRISADSTCDLSPELIRRYNIAITPLQVVVEGHSYRDGEEIDPDRLFQMVDKTGKVGSTTAVNYEEYHRFFTQRLQDADAVIHFTISSDMSSCFQNARTAGDELKNVYVVDSRNLSTGIGQLALDAAVMAREGASGAEIFERMERQKEKLNVSFVIDTLEYLHKGGRCSGVAALGANLLRLKPMIEVTGGLMGVGKKYRGSLEKSVLSYVTERIGDGSGADLRRVFITDSGVSDELAESVREILSGVGFREILRTPTGGTIACHCGPGTLGILYYNQ